MQSIVALLICPVDALGDSPLVSIDTFFFSSFSFFYAAAAMQKKQCARFSIILVVDVQSHAFSFDDDSMSTSGCGTIKRKKAA